MRLATLLISTPCLLLLQQIISIYFLADFFLARDSLTADRLWKDSQEDDSQLPDDISSLSSQVIDKHCKNVPNDTHFDKVILVVIDALGSDFIPQLAMQHGPKNRMPFLEDLIKRQKAMPFIAEASTPTVTMPRIKSLLSGTIPSFIDIAYNLAHDVRDFSDDNIVSIAKKQGKSLVFYGDDTWLTLFNRQIFTRTKETYSFFASDYTTIDTNVTEFALPETAQENIDWDYMFLHYLGLDHIGHNFGSRTAPLVAPKLLEMDDVIKIMFNNMAKRNYKTLMIICGDHGMSEEGNHGGGSDLEANTAMIFVPINHELDPMLARKNSEHIKQIDFAATISLVTGMPIPSTSHGVATEPLLKALWARDEKSRVGCAGLTNVLQLAKLMGQEKLESLGVEDLLKNQLIKHLNSKDTNSELTTGYYKLARHIQDDLIQTIVARSNPILIISSIVIVTCITIWRLRRSTLKLLMPVIGRLERVFCLITFGVPILMLGSTNYLEYERLFWPIFSLISLLSLVGAAIKAKPSLADVEDKFRVVMFIITFIITFLCNNFRLFRQSYTVPLISLIIMCNYLRTNCSFDKRFKLPSCLVIFITIIACKYVSEQETNNHMSERALVELLSLSAVIIYNLMNVIKSKTEEGYDMSVVTHRLSSGWMAYSLLLARPHNFLFLVSNVIMEASLNSIVNAMQFSTITRTLIYTNFAYSAYFNQGNTISFSSIDVRPAFYGQQSYTIWLAVPFVICATYASHVYWFMKLIQRVQGVSIRNSQATSGEDGLSDRHHSYSVVHGVCDIVNARNFLSLSYFMCVCLILRNHIFIWSVLSPKLIFHYLGNNIILLVMMVISNLYRIFTKDCAEANGKKRLVV